MCSRGRLLTRALASVSSMVMKSSARDGSLAVLQLVAAPRDDEASGVAFLLCLTRMDLWISSLDALLLDGGFGVYVGGSGQWFLVKHRLGLMSTSR